MYLAIDVGGTNARVSAFGGLASTKELARREFSMTQALCEDFEIDVEQLITACRDLAKDLDRPIEGIGVGVAGKISDDRRFLTGAGNLTHWIQKPIVYRLINALDCPVILGNDAEAAALAEAYYGHGIGTDFRFVIWGTGVGGCLVRCINGQVLVLPGELGHQQISLSHVARCGCGQSGCLEAYAGGGNLEFHFGRPAQDLRSYEWDEVRCWMQAGVRNAVTSQPVPLVVFGGGVASKQRGLLPVMETSLRDVLKVVDAPRIELSMFKESAGTVGALALLKHYERL